MRLIYLNPRWVDAGGAGITTHNGEQVPARHGVGMSYDCPCGCGDRGYIAFKNPLDLGPPKINDGEPTWLRDGDDFNTLTITPSIERTLGCKWHGHITKGDTVPC